MKRILGLVLAIAMLLTLAAPALADTEIQAKGSYTIDVHLQVPNDPSVMVGGFTVIIPDSIHIQYGVVNNPHYYSISLDPDRFPVGRNVGIDITSDCYNEWSWTDEEGTTHADSACILYPEDWIKGSEFWYQVYAENGKRIIPAPFGIEDREHLYEGYDRCLDWIGNDGRGDNFCDGNINLVVDYNSCQNPVPGNYHSSLTFNIFSDWYYTFEQLAELGYEYVLAEGYEARRADSWDDETAAIDPNGWPWEGRVIGTRPISE